MTKKAKNNMYSEKENTAKVLLELLKGTSKKVLIFIHKSMDGDCIGASCGMCEVIRNLGFDAGVVIGEEVIDKAAFLKLNDYVIPLLDDASIDSAEVDVAIAVDSSVSSRMGDVGRVFDKASKKVIIDHHQTSEGSGDASFIVPEASSASELSYYVALELAKIAKKEVSELVTNRAAQFFLTGIITDTGRFSYSNTRPETLVASSELMKLGAEISPVMYWFFDWQSKEELRISSYALSNARFDYDGKIASVAVKNEWFERFNASIDQIGSVVSKLRDVDGVVAAFVLRELPDGKVRVNMRSLAPFDCVKLATQYDGGGHIRAAGCTVEGEIEMIREEIVNKAIELLKSEE